MRLAGKYDEIGDLSSGGMGRLTLARSPNGQLVVIKRAHAREDDERLRDEARVGMRLTHPHIVETLDLIEVEGRPGLVTAYVSGASLFELRKNAPLSPVVVCRLGRQLAEALDAIHAAVDEEGRPLHMLHRDVTAGNVMVGHDGRARLIDLGIARSRESRAERTDTGSVRGTLRYLAPELFGDGDHSPQSDIWSLGVVLWEALCGREAFKGVAAAAIHAILQGKVMQLEVGETVDGRVQRAIAQLLKVKADDRPRRARDAAALFSMVEKNLAVGVDVTELTTAAVISAVGPPGADQRALVANAVAVFGEEARMQTTGLADVARIAAAVQELPAAPTVPLRTPSGAQKRAAAPAAGNAGFDGPPTFVLKEPADPSESDSSAATPALQEETLSDPPSTPGEAIISYAKMLQDLESPRRQ